MTKKTRKTYTIYLNGRELPQFSHMMRGFANGAMIMAESFFTQTYHFVMKCDQTGEIIDEVKPRRVELN